MSVLRDQCITLCELRCPAQFGADLLGIGMVQAVQDDQGLLPRVPGSGLIAERFLRVADVGQRSRFVLAVAELAADGQCRAVVPQRGVAGSRSLGRVSEGFPGIALTVAVAELPVQAQGTLVVADSLLMIAE